MDLLGGYSSNSDDSNNESDDENDKKKSSPPTMTLIDNRDVTNRRNNVKLPTVADGPAIQETVVSSGRIENYVPNNNNKQATKRGKKLLKLSAVLPDHIWNQLTGAESTTGNRSSDGEADDSDDDNDDGGNGIATRQRHGKQQAPISFSTANKVLPSHGNTNSITAKDSGLLGLLQALPKSKSSGISSNKASIILTDDDAPAETHLPLDVTADTQEEERTSPSLPSSSTSLGAAFMESTVETTIRKRSDRSKSSQVRDIHEKPKPAMAIPTNTNVSSKETEDERKISDHYIAPSSYAMTTSSSLYLGNQQSLPRPSVPRTSTLPSRPVSAAPPTTAFAPSSRDRYHPPQYHHGQSNSASVTSNTGPMDGSGTVGPTGKKQSRKRQMEQLLRAGKIGEIQEDHQLEASANVYVAPDTTSGGGQAAAASSSSTYHGHGLRMVPTKTYDVSTGGTTTSTDISVRQKSKHQLNSLLANAATLEAHRARNPFFGGSGSSGSGTGTAGSHRATAKRKYGW